MTELKAIRGSRPKAMTEARILQCKCGSRRVIEVRVGVAVGADGRIIHRGTLVRQCAKCGELVE